MLSVGHSTLLKINFMSLNSLTNEEHERLRQEYGLQKSPDDQRVSNNFSAIIKYIPTEVVTLYIATIATRSLPMSQELLYWSFVIFTPICHWLVFMGKCGEIRRRILRTLPRWPWWGMFASTAAFAVWALALPNAPYVSQGTEAITGLGALFISTLLSLLEPIAREFSPD